MPKEHQAGIPFVELCRKRGISDATFYNWRSRYGGMGVSDTRRLKSRKGESHKLKQLMAKSILDVATLRFGKASDAALAESVRERAVE